jgi:hypothetical protein
MVECSQLQDMSQEDVSPGRKTKMEQDENTGLWVTTDTHDIAPVTRPPLGELRDEQVHLYGHWTAERDVT